MRNYRFQNKIRIFVGMEKFDVHILGCGSALPTLRHSATSQVVNIREKLFMIDCGEGTQVQLRRSRLRFGRLNHIFISHLHGDHCFGLMGLISTFGMLERTADLHIYAHAELEKLLAPQLNYFCKGMTYKVVFHAIDPGEQAVIYDDRSVSVETIPLRHKLPTCGFLFREKPVPNHIIREMIDFYHIPLYLINRIKNGEDYQMEDGTVIPNARLTIPSDPPRTYAYCSDTCYLPRITEQIKGVDLLFHEATFTTSELARAKATLHSTAEQAALIAREAGVKQLMIGHFSARYEDDSLLLKEASAIFPQTILAQENLKSNSEGKAGKLIKTKPIKPDKEKTHLFIVMSNYNEQEIAQQLQDPSKCRKAFEQVVKAYSEQLYWQIRRMVLSHDDANDLLQNTFIKAWSNLEYFRGDARLSTWLYRIAFNECLNFLNRQRAQDQLSIDDTEAVMVNKLESDPYFDGDETQKLFQKAILQLPEKQRIIFNLKYFQEMKYEEISEILGTSVGALKASYHHAVKKIEEFFEKHD